MIKERNRHVVMALLALTGITMILLADRVQPTWMFYGLIITGTLLILVGVGMFK